MENFNLTVVEKRLCYVRKLKKLSQRELGENLGVSQALIANWENGYQNISLKMLVKVSCFFKVPIDYFFGLITKFDTINYEFVEKLDLKYLGNKIRNIRINEDMSQQEFADTIKTKRSNISYYENGKMTISSADLKDICNTFGYSADWCVGSTKKCIRREKKILIAEDEIRVFIEN